MNQFGNKSPMTSKKMESQSHKVSLTEVQQGLKAIQLKRLSRLSAFVTSHSSEHEVYGAESLQKSSTESLINDGIGTISEESIRVSNVGSPRTDTKVKQNFTPKTVRRRKVLNKFNCASNIYVSSSDEESVKEFGREDINSKIVDHSYNQEGLTTIKDLNKKYTVQKLSQRKPIYFSNEFSLDQIKPETQTKTLIMYDGNYSNHSKELLESSEVVENKLVSTVSTCLATQTIPKYPVLTSEERTDILISKSNEFKQQNAKTENLKVMRTVQRKLSDVSKEEKILRKLHMNYITVNKLLENENKRYEIDSDELENFKQNLKEAKSIFFEYEARVNKLDKKFHLFQNIRQDLAMIREKIRTFRGIQKDHSFVEIMNKLNFYKEEVQNSPYRERQEISEYIKLCFILLNDKLEQNEILLKDLFDEIISIIIVHNIRETVL